MRAARSSGARNDGGGWWRTPVEQALGAVIGLGRPQVVVDDAVQVGVVLAKVAGGVLEVPEEVRPGMVRPSPQIWRSGWSVSIADAPRPTSSTSSTCQEV